MIATVANALLILVGALLGTVFKSKIRQQYVDALVTAMSLVIVSIGITSAIKTADTLCVIVCIILGTLLGEMLRLEERMDGLGETIKQKLLHGKGGGTFVQGFVAASLLFCVGSMALMGSLEAGINKDYSIILTKGVLDCISSISFAVTLGIGVFFSAGTVFVYQGLLTLLAVYAAPFLSPAVVTEMSACGGVMLIGVGINMLGLSPKHIRVPNMLPAMFLPILYLPAAQWISGIF